MMVTGKGKLTAFKNLINLAQKENFRRGGENTEYLVQALAEANTLGVEGWPEGFIPIKYVSLLS